MSSPPSAPTSSPSPSSPASSSPASSSAAIAISGLRKSFRVAGQTVEAVSGIDLTVTAGEIFGLLGPNGAGKTTTLRILTTLLPADAGAARVAGADVLAEPAVVRRRIGYVSQLGGADKSATGRENLLLAGRLYGLGPAAAAGRGAELADVFDLGDLLGRSVRTYSGGQRRRLEVALGIMHRPPVLFLDEPTTGLDPQNRANLWDQLRQLRAGGTTICLTTHYLDEADQLCDRVAIVDHGRVIALGRPDQLKRRYSADTIAVTPDVAASGLPALARELAEAATAVAADTENGTVRLTVTDTTAAMASVFGVLAGRGVNALAASIGRPSLDDVFLRETGRSLRDAAAHRPGRADGAAEEVAA
ncbi:MAG TPA: ATP-binding cassette domain-containing protein [Trebonia sp.]|jgi:ABC-2 type transport system ATP-binding protein|nr:ATP-binding cassette domain-containing protein [Trebonia sp.]